MPSSATTAIIPSQEVAQVAKTASELFRLIGYLERQLASQLTDVKETERLLREVREEVQKKLAEEHHSRVG